VRLLRVLYCLLGVGCADAVQPRAPVLPGRYELEQVNDASLPVVIAVVPPEVIRLTRAVVVIRADSTFSDTTTITYDRSPFGGVETETQVSHGRWTPEEYEWRGDTLVRHEDRRLPLLPLTLKYVRH
jgi:hypothetical protein